MRSDAVTNQKGQTHLGAGNQPSSERVVAHGADGRLVAIEGDAALAARQAEYSHCAVLITYSQADAVGRGAEEGHLVFLTLQDHHLERGGRERSRWATSDKREGGSEEGSTEENVSPSPPSARPR